MEGQKGGQVDKDSRCDQYSKILMVALASAAQWVGRCPTSEESRFDSWSGHMPGLCVWSLGGVAAKGN